MSSKTLDTKVVPMCIGCNAEIAVLLHDESRQIVVIEQRAPRNEGGSDESRPSFPAGLQHSSAKSMLHTRLIWALGNLCRYFIRYYR